jgi:SAM-dependent methyltransferase
LRKLKPGQTLLSKKNTIFKVNKEDKIDTLNRYNERLKELGYSEATLGWSRNKNKVRFEALIKEWHSEISESAICDFGCGFGDFFGFLTNEKKIKLTDYTGIDINENLINIGRELYPEANFWVGDIVQENYSKTFDFIFSSGVFNHKLSHGDEYHFIDETLQKINQLSRKGFAINFLSDKVDYRHEHTFHSNPGKILDIVYQFSNHILLRNDYMPFEFTVYVRKDLKIDKEKIIYV